MSTQGPRKHIMLQAHGVPPSTLARDLSDDKPYALWEASQLRTQENQTVAHQLSRYTTVVLHPQTILRIENKQAIIEEHGQIRSAAFHDPIAVLRNTFSHVFPGSSHIADLPDSIFKGGLIGFLGYDLARYFENIRGASGQEKVPDALVLHCDITLVFDHLTDIIHVISCIHSSPEQEERFLTFVERLKALIHIKQASSPSTHTNVPKSTSTRARFSRKEFVERIERAKEYIRAGDIFQVVLANTFDASIKADPLDIFANLREANPSPYHFLMAFDDTALVGASPEVYLRSAPGENDDGRGISMRLVAGTYPKGLSPAERGRPEGLQSDSKERAEHLMLVDHARNDLGRVARTGSVRVADLFSVETYADVHHLVSEVSAERKDGEDVFSALAACFPIATLTGTPKIRAMEIIAELEGKSRGLFGGSLFTLGYDGHLDSTVIIRSALVQGDRLRIQAGAGIVWDSDPEREYEECLWKAKAVFESANIAWNSFNQEDA